MNPEFNYHLYSDEDCLNFISKYFNSDVVSAFNTLVPGAYKCDLWRYCVLYINGGVYLDIKFYSVVPLITLIKDNPILFVKDRDFGDDTSTCAEDIHNAFMISPPNNIIFKKCIDDIVNSCKFKLYHRNPLDVTGPCLLGRIILQHDPDNFNNYVKNFRLDGDNIVNGDTIIFKQYANYRNDQDKFQKTKRYPQYWWDKNMYGEILVI
jgi:mannosyltransferase OCH1-like enzyme